MARSSGFARWLSGMFVLLLGALPLDGVAGDWMRFRGPNGSGLSTDDVAPPVDTLPELAGWERVARVDTDEYFGVVSRLDRPAQQACSITAASGPLGRYRYLLWELQPNRFPGYRPLHNSFYGEIDIYADP